MILGGAGFAYSVYLGHTSVSASGLPTVNQTPGNITMRVEWLNTFNSAQDRFNPTFFTVAQGDRVIVIFETNDTTDAHTFTLPLSLAGFSGQMVLNNSWPGVTSGPYITQQGHLTPLGNPIFNFTQFPTGCFDGQGSSTPCNAQNTPQDTCASSSYNVTYPQCGALCSSSSPSGSCLPGSSPSPCDGSALCTCNGQPNSAFAGVTRPCNLWSTGSFVATVPGVYRFFCFYHQINGMFGYITVLPNLAYKPS